MTDPIWQLVESEGPVVAVALHDGHATRPEMGALLALGDEARRREEDPYTAAWTDLPASRVVGTHSRFEVDLNRPRRGAVYRTPEDAWGLEVWRSALPAGVADRSLAAYDAFYAAMHEFLSGLEQKYGAVVVYDLHSYNHRRAGPDAEAADPEQHPEVNVGTGTMDRAYWAPVVDRFIEDLRGFDFLGRHLDVRENVRFFGGAFPRFVHEHFPRSVCTLAVEFKKFFMDEWTGTLYVEQHRAILEALRAAVPGSLQALSRYPREDTRD